MLFRSLAFLSFYFKYPSCPSRLQVNGGKVLWKPLSSVHQRGFLSTTTVGLWRTTRRSRNQCNSGVLNFKSEYSTQGEGTEGKAPHTGSSKGESPSSSDASSESNYKENSKSSFSQTDSETTKIWKMKVRLLQLCSSTDRGQNSTHKQKLAIEEMASSLEALNPTPNPVEASIMDGLWYLSYVSEKFYATNALLAAAAVTPLVSVGQVRQEISIASGELTNEVDLILFPNITGTLVTKARITPVDGERLQVFSESTTIRGKSIGEQFDLGSLKLDIPIDELVRRLKGTSPESFLDTYYVSGYLKDSVCNHICVVG